MQKIVNGIAIASGVISLTVVGTIGYVFIRKDAIIENVKSKVMEAVMPDIGGGIMRFYYLKFTGPVCSTKSTSRIHHASPMPEGAGLGIPSF